MRKNIRLVLLMITLVLVVSGCGAEDYNNQGDQVNGETSGAMEFTDFNTTDIYGQEITQEIFRDYQLTMVNVWGTFCGPCIDEMPDLGEIQREYHEKGVNIIGIVVDVQGQDLNVVEEQLEKAQKIAEVTEADYPHLLVSEELIRAKIGEIASIPTSFFVDSKGNFVGKTYIGAKRKQDWIDIIEENL